MKSGMWLSFSSFCSFECGNYIARNICGAQKNLRAYIFVQYYKGSGDLLGWLKLCSGLPKVFFYISIVIFPIASAPKASPSEKFWNFFDIYYPTKRDQDLGIKS